MRVCRNCGKCHGLLMPCPTVNMRVTGTEHTIATLRAELGRVEQERDELKHQLQEVTESYKEFRETEYAAARDECAARFNWQQAAEQERDAYKALANDKAPFVTRTEYSRVEAERDQLRARLARITEAAKGLPAGEYEMYIEDHGMYGELMMENLLIAQYVNPTQGRALAAVLNAVQEARP